MAPYFSIITPTYNRANLLRETLGSVWTQEFTDYEVIVVDDGSTDGTWEWLTTLGDRIQAFQQANGGPAVARNLALEHARGEYIVFLDSDDLLFPWALGTYAAIIQEQSQPSFLTAAVTRFEHPHVPQGVEKAPISVKVFPDYYAAGDEWRWYGMSSFLVRRDCVEDVGGFTLGPVNNEDTDLSLRIGVAPGFIHIQSPVTMAYREHCGGVRHVTRKSFTGALHLMFQERAGNYPGGAARARERWRIIGRHVRACGFRCLNDGMRSEAWQLYRATLGAHLREGRWQYLLGFPVVAAARALKRNAKP